VIITRFSDAYLEQLSAHYRSNADERSKMTWPKNAKEYCKQQTDLADMVDELLARRRGEA
jgi:hypothetical protein